MAGKNGRRARQITKDELHGLKLRKAAVERGQVSLTMLRESYDLAVRGLRENYDMDEEFTIDLETGALRNARKATARG